MWFAQIIPTFRVRTIPVLGTMPALFGLAAASHVLCTLAGQPFTPEPVFKLLESQYTTQLARLTEREDLIFGNPEGPAVDLDDVRGLLCPLWQCICMCSVIFLRKKLAAIKGLNWGRCQLPLVRPSLLYWLIITFRASIGRTGCSALLRSRHARCQSRQSARSHAGDISGARGVAGRERQGGLARATWR